MLFGTFSKRPSLCQQVPGFSSNIFSIFQSSPKSPFLVVTDAMPDSPYQTDNGLDEVLPGTPGGPLSSRFNSSFASWAKANSKKTKMNFILILNLNKEIDWYKIVCKLYLPSFMVIKELSVESMSKATKQYLP